MRKVYGINYDNGDSYEYMQRNGDYVFESEVDCESSLTDNGYVKDDRGNFTKKSYDMTEGELLNANVESFEVILSSKTVIDGGMTEHEIAVEESRRFQIATEYGD